jgi:hypothetical protein
MLCSDRKTLRAATAKTSATEPRAAPQQATEGMISAVPDSGPNAGRNMAPEINAAGTRALPGADLVPPSWLAAGRTPQDYANHSFQQARRYELSGFPEADRTWQARDQAVLDAIKQAAEPTPEQKQAVRWECQFPTAAFVGLASARSQAVAASRNAAWPALLMNDSRMSASSCERFSRKAHPVVSQSRMRSRSLTARFGGV